MDSGTLSRVEEPRAEGERLALPEPLASLGPGVIGATGGSGTRVLARIVRAGGMFIGTHLNAYEDALDFVSFSDRWINQSLARTGAADPSAHAAMLEDLGTLVERHCADLPADARRWGWKEPRSIYLLPFFDRAMPDVRFVHFVRDGRDMAFSDNLTQLIKHGSAALEPEMLKLKKPLRAIALWNLVNLRAADYGDAVLGERYLRVRFEDLCADPATTGRLVYEFFGLHGDGGAVAQAEVSPPKTLGRWRREKEGTIRALEELAGPALTRFGYL